MVIFRANSRAELIRLSFRLLGTGDVHSKIHKIASVKWELRHKLTGDRKKKKWKKYCF